jgi:hypothetical protein
MPLTQVPNGMLSNDLQTSAFGHKNRIINGDMKIDQRYGGTLNPGATSNTGWGMDRWSAGGVLNAVISSQQVTDAPVGHYYSLKYTVTTSSTSADWTYTSQGIEGFNVLDFKWGSSQGVNATLSFWVKCSVAGTQQGHIQFNGSTNTQYYTFQYSIASAATWQYVTVTIPPPPASAGEWTTSTGAKAITVVPITVISTGLSATNQPVNTWGTSNYGRISSTMTLASTVNSTIQVTAVQFEKGSTATGFEYRSINQEYQLCLRYLFVPVNVPITGTNGTYGAWLGTTYATTNPATCAVFIPFQTPMRATPSITVVDPNTNLGINWSGPGGISGGSSYTVNAYNITAVGCHGIRMNFSCNNSSSTIAVGSASNLQVGAGSQIFLLAEI